MDKMKAFATKHWPSILHAAAVAVVFLDPSVQQLAKDHATSSGAIGLAWGFVLAWARSPKDKV